VSDFDESFDQLVGEHLTRRRLLQRGGYGALTLSSLAYLAACGGGVDKKNQGEEVKAIPKGRISRTLAWSNWPLYIDVDEETKERPTLEEFKKRYGTTIKYTEEINDNNEFFGKVRPQYDRGSSGGRDLHVVTDWMCNRMKQLGLVQKLDKSEMPNVTKNIEPSVASPDFDPKREFSVPWQSGQVVVLYRRDLVKGDLKNYQDLLDPKFKGKVTMLSEMRDTVGAMLLAEGKNPERATKQQCLTTIDRIEQLSKDGQIRRFTGNEYTKDLLKGDTVACLGWSGDTIQLQSDNENVRYAQPETGFMVFTDSMQVPVGAKHAFTSQRVMDFYYDPEVQAKVTAYVNYVPPVKGVAEVIRRDDPETAENRLIFPDLSTKHSLKTFPRAQEREIESAFQRAIGA